MTAWTLRSRATSAGAAWGPVLALAGVWEGASRLHWVDTEFFPPLSSVVATVARMVIDGYLVVHVAISAARAVGGFALALIVGIPAGLALGYAFPFAYSVAEPLLRLLSQVNPFSLLPVFLMLFGSGELAKLSAIAWTATWPIIFCTVTAVRGVDPNLIRLGRAMGASRAAVAYKVVLPAAMPTMFAGLRVASTLVFFMLVGAEMLGGSVGLGWLVHNSAMNYQIRGIYAGALLVIVLGYVVQVALATANRRLSVCDVAASASARDVPGELTGGSYAP